MFAAHCSINSDSEREQIIIEIVAIGMDTAELLSDLRETLLSELRSMRERFLEMEDLMKRSLAQECRCRFQFAGPDLEAGSHVVENQAKKLVEGTNSGTDVLRLYNKWHEKLEGDEDLESDGNQDHKEKKGLLQKVKNAIRGKDEVSLVEMQPQADGQPPKANGELFSVKLVEDLPATRQVVECRSRGRSTISLSSKSKISVEALLEEKEERVRYLEEVNMTLKQTNDDLNEEVTEIKKQLMDMQAKLSDLEATSKQLEDDKRESVAKLSTRGWLYKRGVKGPTAKVWRRRYFRCDQGTKICYYKSAAEGAPQGFIDLEKVISVQEVSSAQQDKNNATFFIQCDGRTFHLQAHDESTMRKWMSAIEYLRNWHKKNSVSTNGGGATV